MADRRIEGIIRILRRMLRGRLSASERSDLRACIEELKHLDEQLTRKPPPDTWTRGLLIGSIITKVVEVLNSIFNAH